MSFTLCFIHILFISNEFHKFWMSFDFRWTNTKIGRKRAKTQADRSGLVCVEAKQRTPTPGEDHRRPRIGGGHSPRPAGLGEAGRLGSTNKKTKCFLSVSPFPPSPLNILPSIRTGFDRETTSCEPLFGLATQVTKVCYTLPTQNSTYQPYSRKKMIKISDHGEDHTPWAIWEHYWGILNHFWKTCKTPR